MSWLYSTETAHVKKPLIKDIPVQTRFEAPEFLALDGLHIPVDQQIWNISKKVENLLERRLLSGKNNPLNLLKRRIVNHFNSTHRKPRGSSPLFTVCEDEPRLVTVFDNFDSLLIPKEHPSRRISDTYYVNENYCLRAHTSAHQLKLLRQGFDNFLVIGDVYRRDEIDRTHFPCFHQIEGVRTFAPHELFGENPPPFFEGGERSPEKQELHTAQTAKLLEANLKETLELLCRAIFGSKVEMRWVNTYFPFTHPSFELEVFFDNKWLEVLGCGIMEQKLLESAGAGDKVGWAFGLGLERLAMVLYGIPDIRLFWSKDTGFLSQFEQLSPDDEAKYKQISKQPQLEMDLSFWLPEEKAEIPTESLRADVYDVIRMIGAKEIGEMDEPILVVISLTMFVGSYLAGCIPLFFTLNERRIRIASIFGAGLLVGTALCVIIPEGVSTLLESSQAHHKRDDFNQMVANQPAKNPFDAHPIIQIERSTEMHQKEGRKDKESIVLEEKDFAPAVSSEIGAGSRESPKRAKREVLQQTKENAKPPEPKSQPNEASHAPNLEGPIGVSLLVGFLFMFVVDQLAKMTHSRNKSLSTLGLVIHAFADGIAMGSASSAGGQMEMQILVFVAIMLHKAPAAFALVSILLAQGLEKSRIRRHLLAFSLAAPIGTILTYAFLHMAQSNPQPGSPAASSHVTGIILLFSAGTFLYIATVHVLPELIESKCGSGSSSHERMSGSRELLLGGHTSALAGPISRLCLSEICLFCISALIPAFISSASHGHGH